jgi:hypothetical protein
VHGNSYASSVESGAGTIIYAALAGLPHGPFQMPGDGGEIWRFEIDLQLQLSAHAHCPPYGCAYTGKSGSGVRVQDANGSGAGALGALEQASSRVSSMARPS